MGIDLRYRHAFGYLKANAKKTSAAGTHRAEEIQCVKEKARLLQTMRIPQSLRYIIDIAT